MDSLKIKKVHVVFKTHLDVGFTDLAQNVLDQYLNHHIPASIRIASEMNTGDKKQFIWTVGSYLISYCLKYGSSEAVRQLTDAIRIGDLCWHGLAVTSHSELQDEELLEYNLSLSDGLDRRFGKKTIAAKMTDVPGHTRAIIRHLAAHGIRYLHIGVNGSSMVPEVPMTFVWKSGEHDVIVQYSAVYGAPCYVEGMDEVLEFAHTNDNMGPQSAEAVRAELERIQNRYPNAEVVASTMDQYAEKLLEYRDTLPVVEEEIGDTWIHGVSSDPFKVTRFRALLALKQKWISEGRLTPETKGYDTFMLNLLMVPEHTWGVNYSVHLGDYKNWAKKDFQAARKADATGLDNVTFRNMHFLAGIEDNKVQILRDHHSGSYSFFESSHAEQRAYLTKALSELPEDLQREAFGEFDRLEHHLIDTPEAPSCAAPFEIFEAGAWKTAFGANGEMMYLENGGKKWLCRGLFGRLVYTTYNALDCVNNYYSYNRDFAHTYKWSEVDFSKPGLETVEDLEHRDYLFGAVKIEHSGCRVFVTLAGDSRAAETYGCPRRAVIEYIFGDKILCRLHWTDKDANKMPEALWFDMNFDVENASRWKMRKMGELISPLDVVRGGNRRQHCVESMEYCGADGKITVKNLHSPVISMGGHWLYGNYREQPDLNEGFSCCLFNNKWGTNFSMWCEDDGCFEYEIEAESF